MCVFFLSYSMRLYNEHIHALGQLSSIGCTVQYVRSISPTRTRVLSLSLSSFYALMVMLAPLSSRLHTNEKEVKEQRVISGHE